MKYIAYYRVSTKRQEASGLGLDAQRAQVQQFLESRHGELIGCYTDIESGRHSQRPALLEAIASAKATNATLIIARLDRLSRSVAFIATLMESQISFVCCDMPEANAFTLHIFSALAQQERAFISKRTKEALARKKAQGFSLGSPQNLNDEARKKAVLSKKTKSRQMNKQLYELISIYRSNQGLTYQAIANKLNELGYRTPKGKTFHRSSIWQLEKQMG